MDEKERKNVEQEEIIDEADTEEVPQDEEELQEERTEKNDDAERIASLQNTIARLQADFQNYQNRAEKNRKDTIRLANEGLITKILSVVDNFERALKDDNKDDPSHQGYVLIHQELMNILEKEGVSVLESDGAAFDPNLHHALFLEEQEGTEPDMVIETFQKGYTLGDKLIRPAMVKVSK